MIKRLLRRDEAAAYLKAFGLRTTPASLATMATRGGGPPFLKIGRYCMYQLRDLEDWLAQRSTGLLDSTSTLSGRAVDGLFNDNEIDNDGEGSIFDTGEPGFDEITKLLHEEASLQEQIDTAGVNYDQQFM